MAAQESELTAAEAALGVSLPTDYRDYLMLTDGSVEKSGEVYLDLWSLDHVVDIAVTDAYGVGERVPGFLAIGSDGGGELLGLDLRAASGQVLLVNASGASWSEASYQAPSFSAFHDHIRSGGTLRFGSA